MKRFTLFILACLISTGVADAAVRSENAVQRNNNQTNTSRTATNTVSRTNTQNTKVTDRTNQSQARSATQNVTNRSQNTTDRSKAVTGRSAISPRSSTPVQTMARAAVTTETRTGTAYESCKSAYFSCMDQFCALKNDNYKRCSCSDKIYKIEETQSVMFEANERLTEFTENLDTVGMTASQAKAMRLASEGENALTADTSASKALLQAIMNSIRGEDTNVSGKYSGLNSINISFDSSNAFGMTDAGQAIAAYNGTNLYTAIYGQCRNAVRSECNDASLQRAITAYLMAIEQDCNTVETMIKENQKKLTSAVREGGALLDLARIENRQNHNSDDMTACLRNVEAAVLSEEVCGAGYHKCLDNGEFIDVSTGAPIAGVVKFYELEQLLKFNDSAAISDQKLSKISNNRGFVTNFEKRVKKFAAPALDKCVEKADIVWADYLDKAMLDIFYAQKAKVSEIKQGCFDFVSACYMNGDTALTAAMKELSGDAAVILQPDRIALNSAVCTEYVSSCDNMFDGNIVEQYVKNRKDTDTLVACRAVVKQCFDKFGGPSYENFYYPHSGLFTPGMATNTGIGNAPDWVSLCANKECTEYKSECAKQLAQIDSCSDKEVITQAFGGFDYIPEEDVSPGTKFGYGLLREDGTFDERSVRPTGVATEIYYQIIDTLTTQCLNLQGRFVEPHLLKEKMYKNDNYCLSSFNTSGGAYESLALLYGVGTEENMCPKNYDQNVDTQSWGACLCWENGARRSHNGQAVKCVAELSYINPAAVDVSGKNCIHGSNLPESTDNTHKWCTQTLISTKKNQVCPLVSTDIVEDTSTTHTPGDCKDITTTDQENLPLGIK